MSCEYCKKVSAYLDCELPAAEREAFEKHLNGCAECSAEVSKLKRISNFVGAAKFTGSRHQPFEWRANLDRRRVLRLAQMLTAVAAIVMLFCGLSLMFGKPIQKTKTAAVPNWEKTAVTLKFEPTPSADIDDPIVQVLLKEQP
jgi:anti-sigma factor RsiW